jgi:hypothetical protein
MARQALAVIALILVAMWVPSEKAFSGKAPIFHGGAQDSAYAAEVQIAKDLALVSTIIQISPVVIS